MFKRSTSPPLGVESGEPRGRYADAPPLPDQGTLRCCGRDGCRGRGASRALHARARRAALVQRGPRRGTCCGHVRACREIIGALHRVVQHIVCLRVSSSPRYSTHRGRGAAVAARSAGVGKECCCRLWRVRAGSPRARVVCSPRYLVVMVDQGEASEGLRVRRGTPLR